MTTTSTPTTTRRFAGDPVHSTFGFAVRHMGVSFYRGSFDDVTAALTIDPDGTATLTGVAEVESISITSPADLRAHVLGDDFFAADQHPSLSFRATAITLPVGGGEVRIPGVLTLRGIERDVVATGTWNGPVDDPFGGVRAALELTTTVDRRDFGMSWNVALPKGGDALGTDVRIDVHLELVEEA
ncbi:MAG: YceI family protein [Solirubrobacteraceae bacterium]